MSPSSIITCRLHMDSEPTATGVHGLLMHIASVTRTRVAVLLPPVLDEDHLSANIYNSLWHS